MARNPVRRVPPSSEGPLPILRSQTQEFARRLFRAMQDRGWSQSDLARAAFGTTTDASGYKVAKGRDRVSVYLRGMSVPDPKNLKKLADALGMEPEELAPDLYTAAIDRENPEVAMHVAAGHPGHAHLVINKIVPMPLAVKILGMLTNGSAE